MEETKNKINDNIVVYKSYNKYTNDTDLQFYQINGKHLLDYCCVNGNITPMTAWLNFKELEAIYNYITEYRKEQIK